MTAYPYWARYHTVATCSLCGIREHCNALSNGVEHLAKRGWWFHPNAPDAQVCRDCRALIELAREDDEC